MRKRSLSSRAFEFARLTRNAEAVEESLEEGSARPVERRARNVIVGRALARAGVWRRLWR